jgi:hypothetical protein
MLCLYGIVPASQQPPDTPGIGGASLESVADGTVAAICSELADEDNLTAEDANDYLGVLLALVEAGTVLPLALGTVMPDAATVRSDVLRPQGAHFEAELQRLAGKVEVHVDAEDDESFTIAELANHSGIRLPADADFQQRLEVGEQVAALLVTERRRIGEDVVDRLRSVAVADTPRAILEGPEDPVLRWAFLVEKDRLAQFDDAYRLVQSEYPRLSIRATGPLPPVDFLDSGPAQGHKPAKPAPENSKWGW